MGVTKEVADVVKMVASNNHADLGFHEVALEQALKLGLVVKTPSGHDVTEKGQGILIG